jgi:hypothetical protein
MLSIKYLEVTKIAKLHATIMRQFLIINSCLLWLMGASKSINQSAMKSERNVRRYALVWKLAGLAKDLLTKREKKRLFQF